MPTALVLAAGLGTRLDPITRLVAKAAVPLGERSLLEHVLAWLERQGVTDIVVNLHHHPQTITTLVGDGSHLGLRVRYSWEQPVLGSAGGPRRALPLVGSDPFLIVNGDTVSDVDLAAMLRDHDAMGGEVTMAVVANPSPNHYNGIRMGPAAEIAGFVPKGQAQGTWHFIGVQIARKAIFEGLEDGVPAETVAGFYRDVIRDEPGRIRGWKATTDFIDVGTPSDYLAACMTVAERSVATVKPKARAGATLDPKRRTVIWSGASVSSSASLENVIVAGPVNVPPHFRASNVVIVPRTVLRLSDQVELHGDFALFPLSKPVS